MYSWEQVEGICLTAILPHLYSTLRRNQSAEVTNVCSSSGVRGRDQHTRCPFILKLSLFCPNAFIWFSSKLCLVNSKEGCAFVHTLPWVCIPSNYPGKEPARWMSEGTQWKVQQPTLSPPHTWQKRLLKPVLWLPSTRTLQHATHVHTVKCKKWNFMDKWSAQTTKFFPIIKTKGFFLEMF